MLPIRFILILGVSALVSFILTYFLYLVFKRQRYPKYVPAIFFLGLAIYYYYLSTTGYTGFQDIGRFILALMSLAAFLSGLITGLIIEFILPKYKQ